MTIIQSLEIKNKTYNYINSKYIDEFLELSRVNIFIGENNSGKSRFLRSLFYYNDDEKDSRIRFTVDSESYKKIYEQVKLFEKDYYESLKHRNTVLDEFDCAMDDVYNAILFNIEEDIYESACPLEELKKLYNTKIKTKRYRHVHNTVDDLIIEIIETYFDKEDLLNKNEVFKYNFYKIYIPILRGLRPLKNIDENKRDYYGLRTKEDYFGNKSNIRLNEYEHIKTNNDFNNEIITGCYFYEYLKRYILGDAKEREIIKEYEKYLSKTFFDGKSIELIPKEKDEVISVKIGNEEEQKIYDLGDGIQSIILITLPLFLNLNKVNENNNILVFIEEPEINLHPRLQRKLIKTFLDDKFEHYQFFFTTHSNHFIDRTLENENISIYSFEKKFNEETETEFNIEKVPFNHYPTLNKLGALPSSVLMSNCTILVEGITDKAHYELYLKLYQDYMSKNNKNFKRFEEDTHYSFLVGGGSEAKNSVKEFGKIKKEKIFFITDQDNEEIANKLEKEYKKLNYENYYILPVKEVENLMSKEVIIKILKNWNNVSDYIIENGDFNEENYKHENFYKYLKDNLFQNIPENFPNEDSFKKRFANYEYKNISSYEELTDEIKEVTEKLYSFIAINNEI